MSSLQRQTNIAAYKYRQQGTESRNILFGGLDQPIKSCEKMFLKLF